MSETTKISMNAQRFKIKNKLKCHVKLGYVVCRNII